jgi:hypothetical protein
MDNVSASNDFCVHGAVEFLIDSHSIVSPEDGDWTVSSTAIELLRTLDRDQASLPPRSQIFPCSGFNFYKFDSSPFIAICGCPKGIDFTISVGGNSVEITSESDTKTTYRVPLSQWKSAVLKFSSQVLDFYDTASEKDYGQTDQETAENHPILISEWRQRHHDLQNT